MIKNILAVGVKLASEEVKHEDFSAKLSLLDWDIIIFKPDIGDFLYHQRDEHLGKTCLDDSASFQLKEACSHWRREIRQAFDSGKTILIFLPELEEVYVATGEKQFSGTGRNQRTTRIVELYSNYKALPLTLREIRASGKAMTLTPTGAEALASYWAEFGPLSEYKVTIGAESITACITTKTGKKTVGLINRSKDSLGTIVALPDIDFESDKFIKEREAKRYWTPEAKQFAPRFIKSIVGLDKALRSTSEITPEPNWASAAEYALKVEADLKVRLLDAEREVEEAHKRQDEIAEKLRNSGRLRGLLYEKGKPLENAIIHALSIIGFQAAPYKNESSEFDVVFESPEGRLLGEAEGKDKNAINVDKLRQLAMNIHEDLQRDEVHEPAKGVLFGNGYRLEAPTERKTQFTEKCITAAISSSTALLSTSDLFSAAQYLSDRADEIYAKQCRDAILEGSGLTSLPSPPKPPDFEEVAKSETR